jgi:hypothetical protein
MEWTELGKEEQSALKRLNRGPYPDMPEAMRGRLMELGLMQETRHGLRISREGREMVITALLAARKV